MTSSSYANDLWTALEAHFSLFEEEHKKSRVASSPWCCPGAPVQETNSLSSLTDPGAMQCILYAPQCVTSSQNTTDVRQKIATYFSYTSRPVSFTPDECRFIIDTGASITITNTLFDFNTPPKPKVPT